MNEKGVAIPSESIGKQEIAIKESLYKFKVIEGRDFGEVIVNTQDTTRVNVDHMNKVVTSLGMADPEGFVPKKIDFVHDQDSVLGYRCKKYEVLQKDFLNRAGYDKLSMGSRRFKDHELTPVRQNLWLPKHAAQRWLVGRYHTQIRIKEAGWLQRLSRYSY